MSRSFVFSRSAFLILFTAFMLQATAAGAALPQPTTTAVTSSANPSAPGASVTFTATVTPGSATGMVTFFDGSTALGTVPVTGHGTAVYTTSSLSAGSHSITAVYNDIGIRKLTFHSSTSPALSQTVNPASTTSGATSGATPGTTVTTTPTNTGPSPSATATLLRFDITGPATVVLGSTNTNVANISGATTTSTGSTATATYTATAIYSDATIAAVSPVWSVSPTTYASIDANGVLTAATVPSDQTVTVTASYTYGGTTLTKTGTVLITKTAPAAATNLPCQGTYTNSPPGVTPNTQFIFIRSTDLTGSTALSGTMTLGALTVPVSGFIDAKGGCFFWAEISNGPPPASPSSSNLLAGASILGGGLMDNYPVPSEGQFILTGLSDNSLLYSLLVQANVSSLPILSLHKSAATPASAPAVPAGTATANYCAGTFQYGQHGGALTIQTTATASSAGAISLSGAFASGATAGNVSGFVDPYTHACLLALWTKDDPSMGSFILGAGISPSNDFSFNGLHFDISQMLSPLTLSIATITKVN